MRARIGLFGLVALLLGFAALPAAAQPVPPGSYLATCQRPSAANGMLRAFCRNQFGVTVPAALLYMGCPPGSDIANDNGTLVCRPGRGGGGGRGPGWGGGPGPAPGPGPGWGGGGNPGWGGGGGGPGWGGGGPPPPRGSYLGSCRDANMSGSRLNALCRTSFGGWNSSSIDVNWCRGRDIANNNGRLTCQ